MQSAQIGTLRLELKNVKKVSESDVEAAGWRYLSCLPFEYNCGQTVEELFCPIGLDWFPFPF